MKNRLVAAVVLLLTMGCAVANQAPVLKIATLPQPVMVARYSEKPVLIDGRLDDPVWKQAEVYPFCLGKDRLDGKDDRPGINILHEPGEARVAWDENFLYLAVKFFDSDVVQEGEDQAHLYAKGDVVELFLKPGKSTWYWELYAAPNGKKTTFWYPGRARALEISFKDYTSGLQVGSQVAGTLNDWHDVDQYWTAEMAMPVKDLTAYGDSFGPGSNWRIFIGRYNYSRYLPWVELTMTPQLPRTNYHLYENYAVLMFEK